jgi:hypothetical protein
LHEIYGKNLPWMRSTIIRIHFFHRYNQ